MPYSKDKILFLAHLLFKVFQKMISNWFRITLATYIKLMFYLRIEWEGGRYKEQTSQINDANSPDSRQVIIGANGGSVWGLAWQNQSTPGRKQFFQKGEQFGVNTAIPECCGFQMRIKLSKFPSGVFL